MNKINNLKKLVCLSYLFLEKVENKKKKKKKKKFFLECSRRSVFGCSEAILDFVWFLCPSGFILLFLTLYEICFFGFWAQLF